MSQESDVCCTTSIYDIQNRCIPDEIDLFYFKTCIITHNNNVIEQNIYVSMFDTLSVKEPHSDVVTSISVFSLVVLAAASNLRERPELALEFTDVLLMEVFVRLEFPDFIEPARD